jgi:hypothetical protein
VPLPRLVGVIHLPALPSSPRHAVPLPEILALAVREARALEDAGFEGVIVENFGDVPFHASRVPPATVAAMAVCVHEVRHAVRIAVGVNVLRNDASASLVVAHAPGARGAVLPAWLWVTPQVHGRHPRPARASGAARRPDVTAPPGRFGRRATPSSAVVITPPSPVGTVLRGRGRSPSRAW